MIDTSPGAVAASVRVLRQHGLYAEATLLEEVASERDGARSAHMQMQEIQRVDRETARSLPHRRDEAGRGGFLVGIAVGGIGVLVLLLLSIAGLLAWGW